MPAVPVSRASVMTFQAPARSSASISSTQRRRVTELHHEYQHGQYDQLVGQRVQELAEHADQPHAPRKPAVDGVRDGGHRIGDGRPEVALPGLLHHQPQHHRDEHDPAHRQ
jgi:hypothetical protein